MTTMCRTLGADTDSSPHRFKVAVFCGYSGAGKTTLLERVIPALRQQGQRVSVIKHTHHRVDIDQPGKDSWRHRQAGAQEVLLAGEHRLALLRELERPLSLRALLAEMRTNVDWVLVEGFKNCDLPKLEVYRAPSPHHSATPFPSFPLYPHDPHVCALVTDTATTTQADTPPVPPTCTVLDIHQPEQVAQWLLSNAELFAYFSALEPSSSQGLIP